jgi:hypothetical protein
MLIRERLDFAWLFCNANSYHKKIYRKIKNSVAEPAPQESA